MDIAKNFAKATVSTGYDAAATSIVLTTGHGAKFPAAPFNAVWWNSTDYPDPSDDPNVEIVRVTAIAADTLTVTRGQESIAASTKNTGGKTYKLAQAPTADLFNSQLMAQVLTTRGDLVRRGSSGPERMALGGVGLSLLSDGTDAIWSDDKNFLLQFDDFISNGTTTAGETGWQGSASGGTITAGTGEAGRPGQLILSTSTSSSAAPNISKGASSLVFGGGKWILETAIKLSALSDGTDTYTILIGFPDNGSPTDGVWFEYTHSLNSGNWRGRASNNGSTTSLNGSVAASTNWQTLKIIIAADGSSADFYVDGVQIGTPIPSNIPTSAGRECAPRLIMIKSAGTTARTMTIDYIAIAFKPTTSR